MTADPFIAAVQRRVLDLAAEESWREARLAEVQAAGRIDGKADDWDFDYGDWTTITDARRTTRYRQFGAPTTEPWQRRDDTPAYVGKHRRRWYIQGAS